MIPALHEVVGGLPTVRVLHADAMKLDWAAELSGSDRWVLCSNLPYNVSVPVVMESLSQAPSIVREIVMVQREVGLRLAAGPGDDRYGAVSVRVAYRARASVVRRVPASVFWPKPTVDSVVVRLDRLATPPVEIEEEDLWRVVDGAFAERRKTMRNALRRLGADVGEADEVLSRCGVTPTARPEELDLATFAAIAERMPAR
jgi:16S rRNA (adenine1518-N6/adenine1519-N6)-dimethyltransferase